MFISDTKGEYQVSLQDGSGKLIESTLMLERNIESKTYILLKSLDEIVGISSFQPNFIKIDTDGFDFKVLRSAKQTLIKYKPCIYFEWDKFHLESQQEKPISIFSYLLSLGYEECMIFDNFGNAICVINSCDCQNLQMLLDYTKNSQCNIYYYDVLSFHKDSKLSIKEYRDFTIKS
ncbi:hypothetical protein CQA44_00910 [Helicobacter sp. MIT 14-3879]|nr:hypothetical protein CQA44_00910 [Helicobacter sp. MIT 14-3879]